MYGFSYEAADIMYRGFCAMKKVQKWAGVIAFWLVFAVLFYGANRLFTPAEEYRQEKAAFYQQPEQTLDVIYIGSSNTLRAVTPIEIWRDYGVTGYCMASTLQSPVVTLAYVKEVYKHQQPEVVVFAFESLFDDYAYADHETDLRLALDGVPLSWDKLQAAREIVAQDSSQSVLSYLFPFLRYHSRWSEIAEYSLPDKASTIQMGYIGMNQSVPQQLLDCYMQLSGEEAVVSESSLEYYRQAIEYCKEQGSQVLLIKFPRVDWTAEQAAAQQAFADEMDVPFLDLNEQACWDATGLNLELDFYDDNHVSATGATKLSHYLGAYLQEHYDLTDRRADPAFASWNEILPQYEQAVGFCLHVQSGDSGLTYTLETSESYLEQYQLQPEDFTYTWRLYRDGKCVATEENSTSNVFTPQLDGSGTYTAECAVSRGGEVVDTLTSLEMQIS